MNLPKRIPMKNHQHEPIVNDQKKSVTLRRVGGVAPYMWMRSNIFPVFSSMYFSNGA